MTAPKAFWQSERRPTYDFCAPVRIWITTNDEGIPYYARAQSFGDLWVSWSGKYDRESRWAQFRYGLTLAWGALWYWRKPGE